MKPYYYIYRVGGSHPKTKHYTLESAHAESLRLAGQHPGDTFEILQCLGMTRTTQPSTFWNDGVTPPESGTLTNREKGIVCGTCQVLALGATSMRCEREACPGRDLPNAAVSHGDRECQPDNTENDQ